MYGWRLPIFQLMRRERARSPIWIWLEPGATEREGRGGRGVGARCAAGAVTGGRTSARNLREGAAGVGWFTRRRRRRRGGRCHSVVNSLHSLFLSFLDRQGEKTTSRCSGGNYRQEVGQVSKVKSIRSVLSALLNISRDPMLGARVIVKRFELLEDRGICASFIIH